MSSEEGETTPTERFQRQVLQNYSEGDLEFEKDLIESYKTSITERMPKLREAFEKEDLADAVLNSHDIKGSSGYIGAASVKFVSGKIEALCRGKNLKDASKFLPELETEVKEIIILLDKYMATMGGDNKEDEGTEEGSSEDTTSTNNKKDTTDDADDTKDKKPPQSSTTK